MFSLIGVPSDTYWKKDGVILPKDGLSPPAYNGMTCFQTIWGLFHVGRHTSPTETLEKLPGWYSTVDPLLKQLQFIQSGTTYLAAMILLMKPCFYSQAAVITFHRCVTSQKVKYLSISAWQRRAISGSIAIWPDRKSPLHWDHHIHVQAMNSWLKTHPQVFTHQCHCLVCTIESFHELQWYSRLSCIYRQSFFLDSRIDFTNCTFVTGCEPGGHLLKSLYITFISWSTRASTTLSHHCHHSNNRINRSNTEQHNLYCHFSKCLPPLRCS